MNSPRTGMKSSCTDPNPGVHHRGLSGPSCQWWRWTGWTILGWTTSLTRPTSCRSGPLDCPKTSPTAKLHLTPSVCRLPVQCGHLQGNRLPQCPARPLPCLPPSMPPLAWCSPIHCACVLAIMHWIYSKSSRWATYPSLDSYWPGRHRKIRPPTLRDTGWP